jgi:hypothetical protein
MRICDLVEPRTRNLPDVRYPGVALRRNPCRHRGQYLDIAQLLMVDMVQADGVQRERLGQSSHVVDFRSLCHRKQVHRYGQRHPLARLHMGNGVFDQMGCCLPHAVHRTWGRTRAVPTSVGVGPCPWALPRLPSPASSHSFRRSAPWHPSGRAARLCILNPGHAAED